MVMAVLGLALPIVGICLCYFFDGNFKLYMVHAPVLFFKDLMLITFLNVSFVLAKYSIIWPDTDSETVYLSLKSKNLNFGVAFGVGVLVILVLILGLMFVSSECMY